MTHDTSLSGVIYHAYASTPVYQAANEIRSAQLHHYQRYDWSNILKKWVMWPWPRPFRGALSSLS